MKDKEKKSKVKVVKATQDLIDQLKGNLREADERECWATSHTHADDAVQKGFERSLLCWAGLYEEKPFCCFGVAAASLLGNTGVPWLLGTEDVKKAAYEVKYKAKEYINIMLEHFDYLENWIDARNKVSIKWLKHCGFEMFETPAPYGVDGLLFHRFWKKKESQYV